MAEADRLLSDYEGSSITGEDPGVHDSLWLLLIEVDSVQASLAGQATWEQGRDGAARRAAIADSAVQLSDVAERLSESDLASRLRQLSLHIRALIE